MAPTDTSQKKKQMADKHFLKVFNVFSYQENVGKKTYVAILPYPSQCGCHTGKVMGKEGALLIIGGNVNWCNHCRNQYRWFS